MRSYITYAMTLLQVLRGTLYRLRKFIHADLYLETTRHVSMITITLSKNELNTASIGCFLVMHNLSYCMVVIQFIDSTHLVILTCCKRDHQLQGAGVVVEGDGEEEGLELHKYEDVGWDVPGGFPRGIGRGRDRSFRGRGRENYNNAPFMDNQQEVGGYNQESPRGRGGRNFRGQGWGGYNNDSCVDNQQEAGVVDAIVVVVADKQVAVVQAVREISVLAGEFLPSRACMTLASLKSTEVSIYIGRVADNNSCGASCHRGDDANEHIGRAEP
ncbi:hypothetical protein Tco_0847541 [Tanacetum coccineum]